jgi:YD repeat-containing protein
MNDHGVATQTLPSGITTTNTYNSINNLIGETIESADGRSSLTQNWAYTDGSHLYLPTKFTDTQGNATSYQYTTSGLLVAQTNATGGTITCPEAATNPVSSCNDYGSHGNLTSATDENGHVTSYSYDSHGMPLQDTPPCLNGSTTRPCPGSPTPLGQTSYTFNSDNREATVTDGNGTVNYSYYDANGNVLGETFGTAAGTITCPGVTSQVSICYSYDANGNTTSMTDPTGTTSYSYNALDQLSSETVPGQTTFTCTGTSVIASECYTYDPAGNLLSKQDAHGTITYTYNPDDSLATLKDRLLAQTSFNYNPDGTLQSEVFPNGVTQSMTYNTLGQLATIGGKYSTWNQLTLYTLGYTDPNNGNSPTALPFSMSDVANNTTTYGYNANNSLTAGTQKNHLGTQIASYAYGYDSAGNLNSKTINSTQTTINYNANNLPTSATGGMTASYSYNGQGDLTSRTVNGSNATFGYNNAGQLTNLNGSAMTYTGTGVSQRVGAGSNNYQYDASGLKNQTVGGTGTDFTTLPDGSIISETFSGNTYYYLSDGLGSVAMLTDSSGNIADQYAYDPLGNITSSSGSASNPFTFQGGIYDSVNKLYYTGAGYYDPATGQSFGCHDKGAVDPGEDNCGEDEVPICGGVCTHPVRVGTSAYVSTPAAGFELLLRTRKGNVRGDIVVKPSLSEAGVLIGYKLSVSGLANGWKRGTISISLKLVKDSNEVLLQDKRTCQRSTQCSYRAVMNGVSVWHVRTRGLALTGDPHPLPIALNDYISVGDYTLVREVRREVMNAPPGYSYTMRQVGNYSDYGARFQTRLAIPCKRK